MHTTGRPGWNDWPVGNSPHTPSLFPNPNQKLLVTVTHLSIDSVVTEQTRHYHPVVCSCASALRSWNRERQPSTLKYYFHSSTYERQASSFLELQQHSHQQSPPVASRFRAVLHCLGDDKATDRRSHVNPYHCRPGDGWLDRTAAAEHPGILIE